MAHTTAEDRLRVSTRHKLVIRTFGREEEGRNRRRREWNFRKTRRVVILEEKKNEIKSG